MYNALQIQYKYKNTNKINYNKQSRANCYYKPSYPIHGPPPVRLKTPRLLSTELLIWILTASATCLPKDVLYVDGWKFPWVLQGRGLLPLLQSITYGAPRLIQDISCRAWLYLRGLLVAGVAFLPSTGGVCPGVLIWEHVGQGCACILYNSELSIGARDSIFFRKARAKDPHLVCSTNMTDVILGCMFLLFFFFMAGMASS